MSWSNVALWNVQIAFVAASAAALAAIFRLRPAPVRLAYWQALLALCLVLPLVQPWHRETVVLPSEPPVTTAAAAVAVPVQPVAPRGRTFSWADAALALLAGGMLLRAGWFGLGLVRLARYRRAARILHPMPAPVADACREIGVYPEIALSDEVSGPVTFGFRDPVILLPAHFPGLEPDVQSAVASHELLHVRRRDWLFTAIEELVRAVFWFHPAVWWTLGQIQLAREQSVDREVVKLTEARERYVDALLALSGARSQLDLAPAPLFLRRRHLTARVAAILREADMSRRRILGTVAACAGGLVIAGWLVCARLPLQAAPQYVQDAPGVTVTGADRMMHRNPVPYPAEAREKNIEGTLVLDVQVAADGSVTDATVLSGPAELRNSTVKSVLGWHFRLEAVGRQQVIVEFKGGAAAPVGGVVGGVPGGMVGGVVGGVPGGIVGSSSGKLTKPLPFGRLIIRGLSQAAEAELRGRLNLYEGQQVDNEQLARIRQTVRDFDEHLMVSPAEISMGRREAGAAPPSPVLGLMITPTGPVKPEHAPAPGEGPRDLSKVPHKLVGIDIFGLPPAAAADLRSRLPIKEGDIENPETMRRVQEVVKAFDPALGISMMARAKKAADGALPDVIETRIQIRPVPAGGLVQYGMVQRPPRTARLARIEIQGLAPDAAEELRRRLPVKEGQVLQAEDFNRLQEAVKSFDQHLTVSSGATSAAGADGKVADTADLTIYIHPVGGMLPLVGSGPNAPDLPPTPGVQRIRVGGNVQQMRLKNQVVPVYPEMAEKARVQGVVRLNAIIGTDGKMQNLRVISGHPLLVPAAMEAARQYEYNPTLLNGTPVEVVTQVDVNFTLPH